MTIVKRSLISLLGLAACFGACAVGTGSVSAGIGGDSGAVSAGANNAGAPSSDAGATANGDAPSSAGSSADGTSGATTNGGAPAGGHSGTGANAGAGGTPSAGSGGTSTGGTSTGGTSTGGAGAGGTSGSNGASGGYGCGLPTSGPGFCDNGIRQLPPTGDATIDALLALTPTTCAKTLSKQSYDLDADKNDPDSKAGLTADICGLTNAVYWVSDLDIDCNGRVTDSAKCPGPDGSYEADTTTHNSKDKALSAADTPYVTLPSDYSNSAVHAGTVAAVIYGTKLVYAVFGDTDSDHIIGEGSYALAVALGIPPSPADGGALGRTVTFIVFTGTGTVPADIENQAQVDALGKTLSAKLIAGN